METIKVNMNPNPLDVQTIHASQNDGEARQWEFELHNNGELIDTSDVKEQLVFKAYKNGTEQLLPENGSTPTTSPFKGDIKYPQGLLTDQEFTYRESPTESDGNAKIKNLYGNTLVWNQLVQNGNFADTSWWSFTAGTLTVSNNIGIFKATAQWQSVSKGWFSNDIPQGHKLLCVATLKSYTANNTRFIVRDIENGVTSNVDQITLSTTKQTYYIIRTRSSGTSGMQLLFQDNNSSGWGNIEISNVMLFDLTQMGLDITDPSDFTSLFTLSYYSYNQGSLLSFMGNGIKTVGKNLFNARTTFTTNGITFTNDNGVITINGTATANAFFGTNIGLRNGSYFIGAFNEEINTGVHLAIRNSNGAYPLDMAMSSNNKVASINNDIQGLLIYVNSGTTLNNFVLKPMVSFESPEYFEPYTTSTTSLPISTYFPTGMKSAGSVYDELTESKAITRVGSVDLGTLTWQYNTSLTLPVMESSPLSDVKNPSANLELINCISTIAPTKTAYQAGEIGDGISIRTGRRVRINISDMGTDVNAFRQAMSGVYLYYELKTPTETSFTTASLVTENAEIPLSNNDGVLIGKCTEELSAEPGFHDAKIKLSDADGTCYSNKLQLHVERSPQ